MVGSAWPNEAGCLKKLLQILRVERSLFRASNACASGDHQQPEDYDDDHFWCQRKRRTDATRSQPSPLWWCHPHILNIRLQARSPASVSTSICQMLQFFGLKNTAFGCLLQHRKLDQRPPPTVNKQLYRGWWLLRDPRPQQHAQRRPRWC